MDLLWDVIRPGVEAYAYAFILAGFTWVLTKEWE